MKRVAFETKSGKRVTFAANVAKKKRKRPVLAVARFDSKQEAKAFERANPGTRVVPMSKAGRYRVLRVRR